MKIFLGLGSNLGDRETFLWRALERLTPTVRILKISSFYASKPVGILNQPTFLNLVAQVEWGGTPLDLLRFVKRIEQDVGRGHGERFGPREIDIDLLWAEGELVTTSELTLPHPRLHERLFVLRPLADLAPDLCPFSDDKPVSELANALEHDSPADACVLHLPTIRYTELNSWWLRQALEHMRAFILTEAFPAQLASELIHEARTLLRQPLAEKMGYEKTDKRGSGYTPPGIERVARYAPDVHREFWDILSPQRTRNHLPHDASVFRRHSERGQEYLEAIAYHCFANIDRAYGTTLLHDAAGGEHMLRCSRYLVGKDPGRVLFPDHYDFGLLTLFGGGAAPGLEGEFAGRWWPLPQLATPGNILVGVANTLKIYLPQIDKAFHHRVTAANVGDDERLSYSLFTEPHPDVILPNGQRAGDRLQKSVDLIRANS